MSKKFQISDEVVAITGSPGTGKSYISACMAKTHIELSSGNIVVSNVPFEKHPQIIQLSEVPTIKEIRSHTGKNVLFILDEITRIWGKRSLKASDPDFDEFVAMIRHKGSRIVVITQSLTMIPQIFRSRVASCYCLKSSRDMIVPFLGVNFYDLEYLIYNLSGKIRRFFCLEIAQKSVTGRMKVLSRDASFFDPEIFKFYRSVTQGDSWSDPFLGKFKGILFFCKKCWFRLFLIFLLFVLVAWLFVFGGVFSIFKYFSGGLLKHENSVSKSQKVSSFSSSSTVQKGVETQKNSLSLESYGLSFSYVPDFFSSSSSFLNLRFLAFLDGKFYFTDGEFVSCFQNGDTFQGWVFRSSPSPCWQSLLHGEVVLVL